VNRSAGALFKNALKDLDVGAEITNIKFPRLGIGVGITLALALFSSDPAQAAVTDLTLGGEQMNPASHETSPCANNSACTKGGTPPGFPDW
jgi:hypothetical protein